MASLVSAFAPTSRRTVTKMVRSSKNAIAPSILQSVSDDIMMDNSAETTDITASSPRKHFHCYLLRSLDPKHPLKTYVGYTADPIRRLRQHNGEFCTLMPERDNKAQDIRKKVCPVDEMPFAAATDTRTKKAQKVNGSWAQMHFDLSLFPSAAPTQSRLLGQRRHQSNWALNAVTPQASHFFATSGFNQSDEKSEPEEEKPESPKVEVVEESEQPAVKIPAKFKPYPFQYHQEFIVAIDALTNLGFGIARIDLDEPHDNPVADGDDSDEASNDPKKWVVFVPNVIPGESARIRIYRNYATYSDADLLEIIEASPDRIEPKCDLANICGGCQYQHITVDRQRQMKTIQVQELFERLGGLKADEFPSVLPTLGTDEVFGYRSKITPHYDAPLKKKGTKKNKDGNYKGISCEIGPIGFKEKASRRLVDVPYCHIATPDINEALARVRDETRQTAREGKLKKPTKGATLLLRDAGDGVETDHNVYVKTTVKDLVFRFKAGNFFQNNPFMLPKMVDLVVDAATIPSPSGKAMTHLIDCYCGSGLFAIGSSSSFEACVGIEVNEMAVEEARENAALNGIENCAFVSASAEAIFDPVTLEGRSDLVVGDFPKETTVVVVDPPRKGCSVEFLEQLNEYKPQRVVYMSCDPATQARDAKYLVSYGYEIVSVQPFDLFPQTRHIECLATFELKD
ncbi:tRNA (uracil-5-)-methyltransferase [Skeletonema marinoi]|uniref:tRNA (Uracil-5-)-methyltransferase n=1 Tax=Skeletonema marinoi TaxID=267567 RepID=A0AAD9DCC3_9STRA|nr:tRNA (uracil-5-)-methyltransferase [Skeletonema marinoi]